MCNFVKKNKSWQLTVWLFLTYNSASVTANTWKKKQNARLKFLIKKGFGTQLANQAKSNF